MSYETLSEPDAPLVSLYEMRQHLRVDSDYENDLIENLGRAVTNEAENKTGNYFALRIIERRFENFYQGGAWHGRTGDTFYPNNIVTLNKGRVRKVLNFKYKNYAGEINAIDLRNKTIDKRSTPARIQPFFNTLWPFDKVPEIDSVSIEYSAGYFTRFTIENNDTIVVSADWEDYEVGGRIDFWHRDKTIKDDALLPLNVTDNKIYYIQNVVGFGKYRISNTPGGEVINFGGKPARGDIFVGVRPDAVCQYVLLQVAALYDNRSAISERPINIIPPSHLDRFLDTYKIYSHVF